MIRGGVVVLPVSSVTSALRFYVETLGMKLVEERADGDAVLDAGDGFCIVLRARGAEEPTAPGSAGISVGLHPKLPVREAVAIFENRGVVFDVEDRADAVLAHFRDPDGNRLHLCQSK